MQFLTLKLIDSCAYKSHKHTVKAHTHTYIVNSRTHTHTYIVIHVHSHTHTYSGHIHTHTYSNHTHACSHTTVPFEYTGPDFCSELPAPLLLALRSRSRRHHAVILRVEVQLDVSSVDDGPLVVGRKDRRRLTRDDLTTFLLRDVSCSSSSVSPAHCHSQTSSERRCQSRQSCGILRYAKQIGLR